MKLLIHTCCAPCLILPLRELSKKKDITPTIFFFNPNIHPYQEFNKRLNALKDYVNSVNLSLICDEEYKLDWFLKKILSRSERVNRCQICYEIRLIETAKVAREKNFDAFTTTLLISPYQNFEIINNIGRSLAEKDCLIYLEEDWRPGFREGIKMAKESGMYTQKYCGCIFSEEERFSARAKKRRKEELDFLYNNER